MNQQCYERLGKMLQEEGTDEKGVVCPECGAMMVKRKGMFGEFYGCSSFPRCRGTRNL